MSRRLAGLLIVIMIGLALTGCRLAKEQGMAEDEQVQDDRFVGVYITFAPFSSSEPVYATAKTVYEDDLPHVTYVFERIKGFSCFLPEVFGDEGSSSYWTSVLSPEILAGNIGHIVKDSGREINLAGKIYTLEERIFYFNRVYQTVGGDIYVKEGELGVCVSGKGQTSTQTLTEEITDELGVFSCRVALTMELVENPTRVLFKEMNECDGVIGVTEVRPGDIPAALSWQKDCAYILVCTYSGEDEVVARELLEKDQEYFFYKHEGENGCLVSSFIDLLPEQGD